MAQFLTKAGLIIETDDKEKIECYRAKGLEEFITEPQPKQEVEIESDYVLKPAKKKKVTKKGV